MNQKNFDCLNMQKMTYLHLRQSYLCRKNKGAHTFFWFMPVSWMMIDNYFNFISAFFLLCFNSARYISLLYIFTAKISHEKMSKSEWGSLYMEMTCLNEHLDKQSFVYYNKLVEFRITLFMHTVVVDLLAEDNEWNSKIFFLLVKCH